MLLDHWDIEYLNVISLGCGCCIDYYGLRLARRDYNPEVSINYTGIDVINWPYSDCMGDDYDFIQVDLGEWDQFDWPKYNVILFPKSIGEFSSESFRNLKKIIRRSTFKEDRVFLGASIRPEREETEGTRINNIIKVFMEHHGYQCISYNSYCYNTNDGIRTEFPDFVYPDNIKTYITSLKKKCPTDNQGDWCHNCSIDRYPMLKLGYLSYRIAVLERT